MLQSTSSVSGLAVLSLGVTYARANNMLSSRPLNYTYSSPFRTHDPNQLFPNPFGTVEGRMRQEFSVYKSVENAPIEESLMNFLEWENGSKNRERNISHIRYEFTGHLQIFGRTII